MKRGTNNIHSLNSRLFPFLLTITFFSLLLETYFYSGFLRKHFYLDTKILFFVTIISGLLHVYVELKNTKYRSKSIDATLKINALFFPAILTVNLILLFADVIRYPNYVFTKVHIQPRNFIFITIFSFIMVIIYLFKNIDIGRLMLPKELKRKKFFQLTAVNRSILLASDYYPIAWLFTYLFILLESFIYPGALIISAYIPIAVSVMFGFAAHIFAIDTKTSRLNILNKIGILFNMISIPTTILLFLYFETLETLNYSNYVFSTYHILHTRLLLLTGLGIYYVFMQRNRVLTYKDVLFKEGIVRIAVLVPILVMAFHNLVETTPKVIDEVVLTYKYATKSYDEKMRARWKDFYDYMLFIKDNTSENAVIYHPPQEKPWEFEGNQVLIRYFLHPRQLVSGSIKFEEYDGPKITHVLIVWGREYPNSAETIEYGWPKRVFEGKEIIIFQGDHIDFSTYNSENEIFKGIRGLIEL